MKKYLFILLAILLVGCSSNETEEVLKPGASIPFEIIKYADMIAPIYMNQVPYIAYAENEGQFNLLKARFKVDDIQMDMDKYIAVFVVTQSDSCGVVVDGVYDNSKKLSVQLLEPKGESCEVDPLNHTFVIQVEKGDYEKVQLYNGNIMKSSMDIN